MSALWLGFGLGFVVGAQPGPMSIFLVRSTLRRGLTTGLSIGAGIAVIDTLYASVGAAGATSVLTIGSVRVVLGLIGAAVLVMLGVRTLRTAFRIRLGGEVDRELATPKRAFAISLAATASNPLTIALWTSVFAAATVAQDDRSGVAALALLGGVGAGSMVWFAVLSSVVTALRRRVQDGFLGWLDAAAGAGLIGFGSLLGYRTLK